MKMKLSALMKMGLKALLSFLLFCIAILSLIISYPLLRMMSTFDLALFALQELFYVLFGIILFVESAEQQ